MAKSTKKNPLRDAGTGAAPRPPITYGSAGIEIRTLTADQAQRPDACAPSPRAKRRAGP
ncbi:MAG: hypothetical protein QM704_14865 [Anaeromyxobacteraceae bacterium]